MTDPLDDAHEKLKRAHAHLTNLKRQAAKLGRDPNRHRILVDYDSDEGEYVVFSKMSPEPLPNLSLILGDLIHCARGALDFVAWQLAVKHRHGREPPEKEAYRIQFPITPCLARFDDRRLWPYVSQKARREMLRHQPHPGSDPGNDHLAVVQWISNRDKHRLIVPLFAFINPPPVVEHTFDPSLPPGVEARSSFLGGPRRGATDDEIFYKGDPTTVKLGRIKLIPRPPNMKVYIDPQPPLDILFSGPKGYLSLLEIEALLSHVEFVVSRFKRFF